ncbi:MAG: hypothetical protein LH474_12785 [Chamaesiphon sp.]|nr:hypothetical protein [Chamaesiphon sp.]
MLENNRLQALVTNTVTMIKLRILAFFTRHDGEIDRFKQQVTDGATEIDRELAERYPERYAALKQRAGETKSWYDQQIAEQKANPDRPLPLAQNDLQLTKQAEKLGQTVAETEREVRAKIAAKFRSAPPKA